MSSKTKRHSYLLFLLLSVVIGYPSIAQADDSQFWGIWAIENDFGGSGYFVFLPDGFASFIYIDSLTYGGYSTDATRLTISGNALMMGFEESVSVDFTYQFSGTDLIASNEDYGVLVGRAIHRFTRDQFVTCADTLDNRLFRGGVARVTFTDGSSTRLRSDPTTSSSVIMNMPEGMVMTVIGGATCADGYTWWKIRTDAGVEGWVAEGADGQRFVEPLGVTIDFALLQELYDFQEQDIQPQQTVQPPLEVTASSCPLGSVFVDDRRSNGIISGSVLDTPCNAVLVIQNNRQYWIGIYVTSEGTELVSPVPENQIYDYYHVLPPGGVARYNVSFSAQAQVVTVGVESWDQNATYLNLAKGLIDYLVLGELVCPQSQCRGAIEVVDRIFSDTTEAVPAIVGVFNGSIALKDAAEALSQGDLISFEENIRAAIGRGEVEQLVEAIAEFSSPVRTGIEVSEVLTRGVDNLKQVFDTAADVVGVFAPPLEVIYRNYANAAQLALLPQSGVLRFEAQIAESYPRQ